MRRAFATLVLAGSILVPATWSQGLPDQLNFSRSNVEGFHLYGVSAFFSGSTYEFLPASAGPVPASNALNRSQYGVGGTVGWQRFRHKMTIAARYSANFNGTFQDSNLNRLNHSFVCDVVRPLGSKWEVSVSGTLQEMTLNQSIFEPSALGSISQTSSAFDNVAAAMSVGQFTTAQDSVLLSGTSAAGSPALAVLLGSRILTYTVNAGLSYQPTSRLRFQFASFALGGERRSDSSTGVQNNYVVPRTLGGVANVSMSYSLSPRTEFGLGASQNYVSSRFQKAYATNATASLSRKMKANWFLRGYAGASFTENLQQVAGAAPMRQMIGGASIGYRTRANMFLGTYTRSGYDSSAAAVGTNSNYSFAWNWRRPRSAWGVHSSYTRNETSNTGFSTLTGWQARAGLSRSLSGNLMVLVDGSYLRSRGVFLNASNGVNLRAIRVSLGWTPRLVHTRQPVPADEPEEIK